MSLSLTTQYAVKSLGRHKRRTVLSVLGIGLGCSVCVFMIAFVRGESQMMLRAAAGAGRRKRAPAIVTGDAMGQVSSQTLSNLTTISSATDRTVPPGSPTRIR